MIKESRGEDGFSFVDLGVTVFIIVAVVALILSNVLGVFGEARQTALETDLHRMKNAVDEYMIQSGEPPTADGVLPKAGEYAPIVFNASFTFQGRMLVFYPHFLGKLPRHYNEEVWRIDSAGKVSVAIEPEKY